MTPKLLPQGLTHKELPHVKQKTWIETYNTGQEKLSRLLEINKKLDELEGLNHAKAT